LGAAQLAASPVTQPYHLSTGEREPEANRFAFMTSVSTQPSTPLPTRKKKRWVLRILALLFFVLLLIVSAVQIVLWTDLPRGIVVSQIEKQLGLRLSVGSLSTGWLGHTQLNHVTIGLPLSDKAFLDAPTMKVKNTSLFGLILGQPVSVEAIELDQPHLYVSQDSNGQWNIEQVIALLAQIGGQKPGEASAATSSAPTMPNVHLTAGVVTIVDNQKRTVDIAPLSVDGFADTGVSWKYDAECRRHRKLARTTNRRRYRRPTGNPECHARDQGCRAAASLRRTHCRRGQRRRLCSS
jgi:uncharacterized protein involved in outer membrane biogenesis